jgi:hypothetical protein
MDNDDRPFVVVSPTKIRLMPVAREWAKTFGMSEEAMGKHLLQQHRQREMGKIQREGEN